MEIVVKFTRPIEECIREVQGNIREGIKFGVANLASELEARAKKEVPVKLSNLFNSITHYLTDGGMAATIKATAPYAAYVHEGTGIYGKRGKPIVPVKKKALFWPGAKHPVKSVKGMKPNPFFTRAAKSTDAQKSFEEGIRNYLLRRSA